MQHADETARVLEVRHHRAFGNLEADVAGARARVIEAFDHEF